MNAALEISADDQGKTPLFPNGLGGQGEKKLASSVKIADDARVIKKVLDGEVNAFEALIKKHENHVIRIVRGKVPEQACQEMVQETFISAFRSLKTFRGDKPFEHWLARIAVRTCYDYWRKQYRNKEVPTSALSPGQSARLHILGQGRGSYDGNDTIGNVEDRQLVNWALSHLSAQDRMTITLIHLEGRSVAEAADLLDLSIANVKVRAFRARRKLRKIITRELR